MVLFGVTVIVWNPELQTQQQSCDNDEDNYRRRCRRR